MRAPTEAGAAAGRAADSGAADIGARLDRLPWSRGLRNIVLLISLGCVFEFYDLFFTAYVAPGMIASDWQTVGYASSAPRQLHYRRASSRSWRGLSGPP